MEYTPIKYTYCTTCKTTVKLLDFKYIRLANNMAVIEGFCNKCNTKLIKGKIMPKSGKSPLRKHRRKNKLKKLSVYRYSK